VEQLGGTVAVLYPILLRDRIELLIGLPDGIHRTRVNVAERELTAVVRVFRRLLQAAGPEHDYLPHGRRLYDWLVRPLEPLLEQRGIDTLVWVPDGPLRTIPMAALHDGEAFLVERYALATTLGLTLTDPRTLAGSQPYVLAAGLTESVQGFPELPAVQEELDSIRQLYPATLLQDQTFRRAVTEKEVATGDYAIVHLATHGEFNRDHERSFLLLHDDRLTMQSLQSVIDRRRYTAAPLELLVLSACETAAGDDRAALGLAGVALRSGARSAVATLWSIADESTAALVGKFYEALHAEDSSKAVALQRAQVALLQDERYRHPYYWAPFLLIGNWL